MIPPRPTHAACRPSTVRAALEHDGRFLLVQHHYHNPANYGKWSLPGGRIEPDDPDRIAALRRELREEFKLEVTVVRFLDTYTFRNQTHHLYHARSETPQLHLDPAEIAAVRWATPDEVAAIDEAGRLFAPFMLDAIRRAAAPPPD